MLKRAFILFLFMLFVQANIFACGGLGFPCYGGEIKYTIDSTKPLTCNVSLTLFFDRNEVLPNDSVVMNWGDGDFNAIYATVIDTDLRARANNYSTPIFSHTYYGSHTYAAPSVSGYYTVSPTNLYRIPGINNINNGQTATMFYYIQLQVGLDSTSRFAFTPSVLQPVDIWFSGLNTFLANELISATPNDSLVFQLVSPLQAQGVVVPNYQYPNEVCGSNDSLAINSSNGLIRWLNACSIQGNFDMAIVISTYRNGKLIGSIMRDQLVIVQDQGSSAISNMTLQNDFRVYPNPSNSTLHISMDNTTGSEIELSDLTGRLIMKLKANNNPAQAIDISGLPQGVYLISCINSNGKFSQKLVKE